MADAKTLSTILLIAGIVFAVGTVVLFIAFGFLKHILIRIHKRMGRSKELKLEAQNRTEEKEEKKLKPVPEKTKLEEPVKTPVQPVLAESAEERDSAEDTGSLTTVLKKRETEELNPESKKEPAEIAAQVQKDEVWDEPREETEGLSETLPLHKESLDDDGMDETMPLLDEGLDETKPLRKAIQNAGGDGEKETELLARNKSSRNKKFKVTKKIIISHEKEGIRNNAQ